MDPTTASKAGFDVKENQTRDHARSTTGINVNPDLRTHGHDPNFDGRQSQAFHMHLGAFPWPTPQKTATRKRHKQRPVSPSTPSADSDVSMSDASPPPPKRAPAPEINYPSTPESPPPHIFGMQGPMVSEIDYARYDVAAQLVVDIQASYDHITKELNNSGGGRDVMKLSRRISEQISRFRLVVDFGDLVESIRETLVRANEYQKKGRSGLGGLARTDLIDKIENLLQRILKTVDECKKHASRLRDKVLQAAMANPKPTRQSSPLSANLNIKGRLKGSKSSGASKIRQILHQQKRSAQFWTVKVPKTFKSLVDEAYGLVGTLAEESRNLTLPIASQVAGRYGAARGDTSAGQRVEIPAELLSTRAAVGQIFDLLCRGCPSEDHQTHQLLLGLATETAAESKDEVQFYVALEGLGPTSPERGEFDTVENTDGHRLWFRVASKVDVRAAKATTVEQQQQQQPRQQQFPEPMDIDGASKLLRTPGSSFSSAAGPTPTTTPAPSPPTSLPPPAVQPPPPAVRFCLTNHVQHWTNSLAVSLTDPAHRLFYPRLLDRSSARFQSPPTPLAALLADDAAAAAACPEEKIRWMRLLAEAVLKFNTVFDNNNNKAAELSTTGGSGLCLDEKSVFFYNTTGGKRELHWRVDLVKSPPHSEAEQQEKQPAPAPSHLEGGGASLSMKSILQNLGDVFLRILRSPDWPIEKAAALSHVKKEFNGPLHNVVRDCLEGTIGQSSDDFGKEEVQRKFYEQVVCKLRKREEPLKGLGARRRGASAPWDG